MEATAAAPKPPSGSGATKAAAPEAGFGPGMGSGSKHAQGLCYKAYSIRCERVWINERVFHCQGGDADSNAAGLTHLLCQVWASESKNVRRHPQEAEGYRIGRGVNPLDSGTSWTRLRRTVVEKGQEAP